MRTRGVHWTILFNQAIFKASTTLQEAIKRPDSMLRHMPVWSYEEIQAARHHIFTSQLEADVESRYSRWGGIPRFVLELTDANHQALLTAALDSCNLSDLTSSMTDLSTADKVSHRILHLTVEAGTYLKGPVVFASDWVQGELVSRYLQFKQHEVHDFLAASGGAPSVAAFRGALWERHAHVALQRGGRFSCRDLQDPEASPFETALRPCSRSVGLWNVQDISTRLSSGVYGWGRSKNLPAVDAVIQPDKLFQITVSGEHRINVRGLADAVRAMQAEMRDVQFFFVVPPDVFSSYTKQTLKRIRGDLPAESVARAVKQFVLKVDI